MGAGGFVTGLVVHPTVPDVMYARTDVGGAYRWDAATSSWEQMISVDSVPDASVDNIDYFVEAVAVAPSDPQVVLLSTGHDSNPQPGQALDPQGRVLRSTDGGRTFQPSSQRFFIGGNQTFRVGGERLAIHPTDPNLVLLGTRREGLWRSIDGGATFAQVAPDLIPIASVGDPATDQAGIGFVSFAPARPDGSAVAYAGVSGAGMYRSVDGGITWEQIRGLGADQVAAEGLVVDDRLYVALNRGAQDFEGVAGIEVWDDGDGAWTRLDPPFDARRWTLTVNPVDPRQIFLTDDAVRDGHWFTSTDGGATWVQHDIAITSPDIPWLGNTDLDGFMTAGRLVYDPHRPGRIWFAEGMGVWFTDDPFGEDGEEVVWESESVGIEELVTTELITPPGVGTISSVADRQGFRHESIDAYPERTLVDETFVGGNDLDYSGGDPNRVVWVASEYNVYYLDSFDPRAAYSEDGGRTWTELPNLVREQFAGEVAISATDPDTIVWLPSYYNNPFEFRDVPVGLFVTSDRGATWTNVPDVGGTNAFHRYHWWNGRQALAADKVDGRFYLLSDEQRFFVSSDGGLTWEERPGAPPCLESTDCHVFGQLRAVPGKAGNLWATAGRGGLWRTADGGGSWTAVEGFDDVRNLSFGAPYPGSDDPAVFVYGLRPGDDHLGVWVSPDDGATWTLVDTFPDRSYNIVNVVSGDLNRPGRVYVGFTGTGFVVGDDTSL
jgi:photosystem II stability/assembly factor-like uncharacterized protein